MSLIVINAQFDHLNNCITDLVKTVIVDNDGQILYRVRSKVNDPGKA